MSKCHIVGNLMHWLNYYHKFRKSFSKLYHSRSQLIIKYDIGLKVLEHFGPVFYVYFVYKFNRKLLESQLLVINSKDYQTL